MRTPAPPPALRPRKRFIVQAGSEASEAWFWLARCAASETLTFLQGLHLELVSCSGCAGLGRSLARLCDWARLSLYGPRDGWSCQTVICQSLAIRFKPEHNAREKAHDWWKGVSKEPVIFQSFANNHAANLGISQSAGPIQGTKKCYVLYFYPKSFFFSGKYCVMIRNTRVIPSNGFI